MGEVQKAIEEITYRSKKFPEEAFRVITENKEEAIPYLREAVNGAISKGMELDEDRQLHFYALYLLGEFQDKASFSKIVELVSLPEDTVDYLLGDCVTEGLRDILYNTYDGKENVYHGGEYNFVYDSIGHILCQCHFMDMLPEIRYMLDNDLLDETSMGKYDSYVDAMFEYRKDEKNFCKTPFNAADNLRHWTMFSESTHTSFDEKSFDQMIRILDSERNKPVSKVKIGRNDPCPCGSGKKYKYCCLNKPKAAIDLIESPDERSKWLERYPYTGSERIDGISIRQ